MSDSVSSETESSDHKTHNDVFLQEAFDPLVFINSTMNEKTLGSLNDTLVSIKESINRNKIKNQELVRRHFSKFVHCRESIEEIRRNDAFSYVKNVFEQIEHNLTTLRNRIREISSSYGISAHSSDENVKRAQIAQHYNKLINLEQRLRYDLKYLDYEGFVKHYNSALKLKNDSKFLMEKLKAADAVKNRFLDILMAQIEKNGCADDTLFYFKLYFKIERDEHNKMENTLLTLVKKYLNDKKGLVEIESVLIYILKNLSIVKTFLIEQHILDSTVAWINTCVEREFSVVAYRMAISRLRIFYGLISNIVNKGNLGAFRESVDEIKNAMTVRIFSEMGMLFRQDVDNGGNTLDGLLVSLDEFVKLNDIKENLYVVLENMLRAKQRSVSNDKSNAMDNDRSSAMDNDKSSAAVHGTSNIRVDYPYKSKQACDNDRSTKAEIDYRYFLQYSSKIINARTKLCQINRLLNNTMNFKRVDKIIKKCETETIREFVKNIPNKSTEHVLMTLMKLKEMYFLSKETLEFLDPEILKCKILVFFLCDILEVDEPELSMQERNKMNEIYAQFSSLRHV
ncbi:Sec5 subunit of exocyst complex [Trachipleistophora hominis]|uniref:Sec5 subunit of exocyst complex n=1 Tax=Trachipleistophora hominis TaxID=72359 RepID=L7JQV1_TRAHO|nr:Sec5 subunit of exocyst complex [Trachipleistophora hominis]